MTRTTGFLILDVSDEELEVLRAVHDGDLLVADYDEQVVTRAVERGLLDRVAGTYGGVALTTASRHTLWNHDRPRGLQDEPWERCEACGSTSISLQSAWSPGSAPIRADCHDCGYPWIAAKQQSTSLDDRP